MLVRMDSDASTRRPRRAADGGAFAEAWDGFVLALRRSQARGQGDRGELTLAQYYLLEQLRDDPAQPVSQLAVGAGISPPTATRLIDSLERAGLLERARSEADRRSVLVSLTDLGRAALARKEQELIARRMTIYKRLKPQERRQSEQLLRHLAEVIDQL